MSETKEKKPEAKPVESSKPVEAKKPGNPRDALAEKPKTGDAKDAKTPREGDQVRKNAERIADGHAWTKHGKEFPECKDKKQFASHVENVMRNPTETKKLQGDRQAYWHDSSKTFVVQGDKLRDGGTAFKPHDGKAYYDKQRKA